MEPAVWVMTVFTGAIGLTAIWAAIANFEPVFQSRKIAFLGQRLGRTWTRLLVALSGIGLVALALSFILLPPV